MFISGGRSPYDLYSKGVEAQARPREQGRYPHRAVPEHCEPVSSPSKWVGETGSRRGVTGQGAVVRAAPIVRAGIQTRRPVRGELWSLRL